MNDFSSYIRNFGSLTVASTENNALMSRNVPQSNNSYSNMNQTQNQYMHYFNNQQSRPNHPQFDANYSQLNSQVPRIRGGGERPIMGAGDISAAYNNNNYTIGGNNSRTRAVPSPVGFNINLSNTYPSNNDQHRSNNHRNINQNNHTNAAEATNPPHLPRSNTFVIENNDDIDDAINLRQTRSVDVTEFYNVQRRPRAKTPMTFNVMLDEPVEMLRFDQNGGGNAATRLAADGELRNDAGGVFLVTPAQSKVNYGSKKKAKLVVGKPGKEYGEFIWPVDVAINSFNNQVLIADSNNHRIQIFEPDGSFVRSFGRQGNREGQFDCISGIFVDSMSNIYVVDRLNHRKALGFLL